MPAHVQQQSLTATSSGSSVSFPVTAVGVGNTVVAVLQFHNATNTITSVVMGGNTLSTSDAQLDIASTGYSTITIYGFNITGGPTALVVNFSGAPTGTDQYLIFDEYSATGQAKNASSAAAATSSIGSLGSAITTTKDGCLVWTANFNAVAPVGVPAGFTQWNNDTTNAQYSADEIQAVGGSVTPTWTSGPAFLICVTLAIDPPPGLVWGWSIWS